MAIRLSPRLDLDRRVTFYTGSRGDCEDLSMRRSGAFPFPQATRRSSCQPRAGVLIEPFSAISLCKTGVFRETAGDFPPFRPGDYDTGSLETKPNAQKAGISEPVRRRLQTVANRRLPGWGGRDRTSEWGNQNPLPYRLATPQQAAAERARPLVPPPVRQRRSIDGVRPFQQAEGANFTRNRPSPIVPFT
jgi:hypothetical protein